jgi:hypothetical protein
MFYFPRFTLESAGCLKCINNRAEKFVKSERSMLQGALLQHSNSFEYLLLFPFVFLLALPALSSSVVGESAAREEKVMQLPQQLHFVTARADQYSTDFLRCA